MAITPTTRHGLSKQDGGDTDWDIPLNDTMDTIDERLDWHYAGNPNTHVAGEYVGQKVYDTTNGNLYICTTAGNAAGAVWDDYQSLLGLTFVGDVSGTGFADGSISLTIGANKVTKAMMAQMASQTVLGRDTAGVGNAENLDMATLLDMLGQAGVNTGDQTITLTGAVTGSGTGTFATTIAAGSVAHNKLVNAGAAGFLGASAAGAISLLTVAQAIALLASITNADPGKIVLGALTIQFGSGTASGGGTGQLNTFLTAFSGTAWAVVTSGDSSVDSLAITQVSSTGFKAKSAGSTTLYYIAIGPT